MVDKAIIETATEFIKQIPNNWIVKKSYLFGSYAQGKATEYSDIDIAIVIENMTDFFDVQLELMRLRRKIDLRIEPHPISEKDFNDSNPFAYEIQKTGMLLQ